MPYQNQTAWVRILRRITNEVFPEVYNTYPPYRGKANLSQHLVRKDGPEIISTARGMACVTALVDFDSFSWKYDTSLDKCFSTTNRDL